MPNRNYVRGRAFEYQRMKYHREQGADIVWRNAGSRGAFDIGAIYLATKTLVLEQCKASKEKVELPFTFEWLYCRFDVVRPERRGKKGEK